MATITPFIKPDSMIRSGLNQKPILAWFDNRLFLTDPQQQKILCELQIRTHHNGRKLQSPEIALPAINEKGEAA